MTANTHVSVLLAEAVAALAIRSGGIYVDATFGRGGHSRAILELLAADGRLIALDRDPAAIAAGAALVDPRFTLAHAAFSEFDAVLDRFGVGQVDGVLLDIGVSSPQLNTPERGMSFRFDAPLDMRMDTTQGETAAEFLARASQSEIERVVRDYGEERFAHAIAKALVAARGEHGISRTGELATLVAQVVRTREPGQHPATRTFQALRIHVNRELEELSLALPRAVARLAPGGRLAVICFHSLEDRIVKRFLRDAAQPLQPPKGVPVRAVDLPQPVLKLVGKATFPSAAEIAANPRCRSAVLRVAQKVGAGAGPTQDGASHESGAVPRRTSVTPAGGRGPGGGVD
ncbi:16S rRNA (cytosine(1402)-N(4))-methyltransferase RsmH [Sulfuritalea sp.]|uniref:16S rRNA (cytosine(1402)-N(4))-methyltransferase RsmH n=1 Tax=Sulfuritalea sp. TaxID=2480090 RepID=UPI00286E0C66|nr:16S rRNA (cytosine(1402)-N(4))-methyltransferase RsmH [Sulfuritalea sp.]